MLKEDGDRDVLMGTIIINEGDRHSPHYIATLCQVKGLSTKKHGTARQDKNTSLCSGPGTQTERCALGCRQFPVSGGACGSPRYPWAADWWHHCIRQHTPSQSWVGNFSSIFLKESDTRNYAFVYVEMCCSPRIK